MVETMAQQYPVRELCALLEVTRSGYYAWHNGRETARDIANRLWTERIRGVYHQKKGRYGSPRVTEQLRREGHRCNHKRVERLMRQHKFVCGDGPHGRRCRLQPIVGVLRGDHSGHDLRQL